MKVQSEVTLEVPAPTDLLQLELEVVPAGIALRAKAPIIAKRMGEVFGPMPPLPAHRIWGTGIAMRFFNFGGYTGIPINYRNDWFNQLPGEIMPNIPWITSAQLLEPEGLSVVLPTPCPLNTLIDYVSAIPDAVTKLYYSALRPAKLSLSIVERP